MTGPSAKSPFEPRRLTFWLAAAGLALGAALAFYTILSPYDHWWAGSVWSVPRFYSLVPPIVSVAVLLLLPLLWRLRPASLPMPAFPWRFIVPTLFAAAGVVFSSQPSLGDQIPTPEDFLPRMSSPGAGYFNLIMYQLSDLLIGRPRPGLYAGFALLSFLWSHGLFLLFEHLAGRTRGAILATGLTFSLLGAQFAGYFEESGMVAFLIPYALLFCSKPEWQRGTRRNAVALLFIIGGTSFHYGFLCLAPAILLSCLSLGWGSRWRALRPAPFDWPKVVLLGLLAVAGALLFSALLRLLMAVDPFAGLSDMSGGDLGPFVPIIRGTLLEDHFTDYVLFTAPWLKERSQFLGALGGGLLALALLSLPCLVRDRVRVLPLAAAASGAAFLYLVWNFDLGMVQDWNLVATWATAAALACMAAGRPHLRRLPVPVCAALAFCAALPGVSLILYNHSIGPQHGVPDPERWSDTTGDGRYVMLMAEDIGWGWIDAGEPVRTDGRTRLEISFKPLRYRLAIVDRIELVPLEDPGAEAIAVEGEDLPGLSSPDLVSTPATVFDDLWGPEGHPEASGALYVVAERIEKAVPLVWKVVPPPGLYQLRVRTRKCEPYPQIYYVAMEYQIEREPVGP